MPSWIFPQAGVNRAVGKQRQPPYTTPDAQNALPESPQDGRIRGGVRPGLVRMWKTSSNSPIYLLDSINIKIAGSTQAAPFRDSFDYVNFPTSWIATANCVGDLDDPVDTIAPTLSRGSIIATTANVRAVMRRVAPTDMKSLAANDVYRIGAYIRPYQNAHYGEYSIFFRLDTSPDVTADTTAMELRFKITGTGTISAQLYLQNAAITAAYTDTASPCHEGWLDVRVTKVDAGDTIDVYWRGLLILNRTSADSTGTSTNAGWGIGMRPTVAGGRTIIDRVRFNYAAATAKEQLRPITFFVQDGKLFHDRVMPGIFVQAGSGAPFASDRQLQCATLGSYVYFADNSDPLFTGTDGTISGGNTFSSAANPDLFTNGLSTDATANNYFGHYAVHVTSPTAKAGVYAISALTNASPDTLTIYATVTAALAPGTGGATNSTGDLVYRIERIPKFWLVSGDTISPWVPVADGGTIPCGCRAVHSDGGRLYLAADPLDPNQTYGSAIGEPHNWQFTDVEPGSSFKLGSPDAGKTGDAVVGIMGYADDLKLLGCRSECWIMKGAPPDGGSVTVASRHAGLLSTAAFCHGETGELYWVGRNGLHMAMPNSVPLSVSKIPLPRELTDLDAGSITACLGYDQRLRGVLIWLTPNEPVAQVRHWFYYVPTKAFFPIVVESAGAYPTAVKWIDCLDPEDSALYIGGYGGSIRRFSMTAANDDLDAITSYVDIGPIELGDGRMDEALTTLRPVLAADSGNVTYQVYFGTTMEAAMDATVPFSTGTFTAASNVEVPVRGSGGAVRLRLIGTAGRQWAMERIVAAIEHAQRAR